MDTMVEASSSTDGDDNVVLRFALATYAMKHAALGACTAVQSSPTSGASSSKIALPSASPTSPAGVHGVTLSAVCIQSAADEEAGAETDWTVDDLLSALHECLQDLQTARGDSVGDREEEAARVFQLLHKFTVHSEPRECLLRTLVDALVACEEGEGNSLLIECVSQVMVYLCFASLAQTNLESNAGANDICEEACSALIEALAEMQEEDFQFSAGGKIVAQTLNEIQTMLRVFSVDASISMPEAA